MKVPLSWLSEFVDLPVDVDDLARGLSHQGLKVESIQRPASGLSGVVVGEVMSVVDHPDADRLVLVDVNTGDREHRIVCGARNFEAGDRVPVALPGAILHGGLKIQQRKVRGQVSDGMLCSPQELGMGDDHSGILILESSAPIGEGLGEVIDLTDTTFVIDTNANRSDVMSIVGVAREVSALTGAPLKLPESNVISDADFAAGVEVEVQDADRCSRYIARVINGVGLGPSPRNIQRRLRAAGVRPISGVVDATNYAMLVTGQPLHAFDLDLIAGSTIVVRQATATEQIVTIDDVNRKLDPDDLVIADGEAPVAMAGVMGGQATQVTDSTSTLLLESACFDPRSIRRTSLRHGLRSESSARFEKGVDPNGAPLAADLACSLITQWSGGKVAQHPVDIYPSPRDSIAISLRSERARAVLGVDWESNSMVEALRRLGFEISGSQEVIEVKVPTFRGDLAIEEDLIEEVARVIGYEEVPSRLPPSAGRKGVVSNSQRFAREVRQSLRGLGLTEVYTSSFIGPADLELMSVPEASAIPMANSLSSDESILRHSLLPGLLRVASFNHSRRRGPVRIFELGKCFAPSGDLPDEELRLGVVLAGGAAKRWYSEAGGPDFYEVKGIVEDLLASLRVVASYEPFDGHPFTQGSAAQVVGESGQLGPVGQVAREIATGLDLPGPVFAAELKGDFLESLAFQQTSMAVPPRFPAVYVDLSVSVDESVPVGRLTEIARSKGGRQLEDVRVFDVYRGEQVGAGRKSVALTLVFRDPDKTLTDKEVLPSAQLVGVAIEKQLKGEVRRA